MTVNKLHKSTYINKGQAAQVNRAIKAFNLDPHPIQENYVSNILDTATPDAAGQQKLYEIMSYALGFDVTEHGEIVTPSWLKY